MIKKKQTFLNLLKGPDQSNPKLEAEEKANNHNRSQNPFQYRYRQNSTLMMILITTTTLRIIEVNPEAIDLIEANIQDDFSEVKICVVEANALKTHTKAKIRVRIIKVIITKAIVVYTTTHIETINRVTIMANSEAEAMVMAEVITMDVLVAGLIIEAITLSIPLVIMVMINDYQSDQYGPPCALCGGYNHFPKHCFKGEHDINDIMEKMNISGHQSQQSGLYS